MFFLFLAFENGIYVKDEGPYEHPELKVMGIHKVHLTPSVVELDSINRLRNVKTWDELDRIRDSISPASLPPLSSQTSKQESKSNWGQRSVKSQLGVINKVLDLAEGNGVVLEPMERTAL